jgi:hypothetical protein
VDESGRTVTMSALIELLGYAGAAAALVATLIAVEQADGMGDVGGLLVGLAITAVLIGVGLAIPPDSPDDHGGGGVELRDVRAGAGVRHGPR